MQHYIAPDSSLHCIDPAFAHMLPAGSTAITDAEAVALRAAARPVEQVVAGFTAGIQKRLDDFAKTRSYDSIMSACTYATDPNPRFAAEGQYCVNKRSETWAAAYVLLAEVQAGERPMPTALADVEPFLPALEWPQ